MRPIDGWLIERIAQPLADGLHRTTGLAAPRIAQAALALAAGTLAILGLPGGRSWIWTLWGTEALWRAWRLQPRAHAAEHGSPGDETPREVLLDAVQRPAVLITCAMATAGAMIGPARWLGLLAAATAAWTIGLYLAACRTPPSPLTTPRRPPTPDAGDPAA